MHDAFKQPEEAEFAGKSLSEWYLGLPRGKTRMGVGGKIFTPSDIEKIASLAPISSCLAARGSCITTSPNACSPRPNSNRELYPRVPRPC
ncbi:hypothetical protein NBRC116601_31580 [Cognatishimia sp. WU-CL00825]